MLFCLIGLAAATHVTTFEIDPLYTKGPISGLESLAVDPATALGNLRPAQPPFAAGAEEIPNGGGVTNTALQFTNPTSTWAEFSVNGVLIGTIGPYATTRLEGLKPGLYQLTLKLPTGIVRTFVIRRGPPPRPRVAPVVTVAESRLELSDKIYFELDSSVIDKDSHELLDAVAAALVAHAEVLKVVIEGHTDSRGETDYNQQLSDARAAAVREYLVQKGVAPERLASAGFGESRPVDANETETGWEANRRVEFVIAERFVPPPVEPVKPPRRGPRGTGGPK